MKLNQVIASFQREITKAQASSDAYAQEVKESYKGDLFLRLLPVPRAAIKEVKLALKYAILESKKVYKWVLGSQSNLWLSFKSIDIESEDSGQTFIGNIVLRLNNNNRRLGFEAKNSGGNNYEVEIDNTKDNTLWVIGDRTNQRVVALNLRPQDGKIKGTVTYDGEDSIEITCVKAEEEVTSEGQNVYIINYNNIVSTDNMEEVEVEVLTDNLNDYPESMLSSISITLDMDST